MLTLRENWGQKHIKSSKVFMILVNYFHLQTFINKKINNSIGDSKNRSRKSFKQWTISFLYWSMIYLFYHLPHDTCYTLYLIMLFLRMEKLNHDPRSHYPYRIGYEITETSCNDRRYYILFPFWILSFLAPLLSSLVDGEKECMKKWNSLNINLITYK